MRREPAAHPGRAGGVAQLDANPGWGAGAAAGGAPEHAEERANRQPGADREPRLELLPGPPVHPDLAALAALAAAHQHGAACPVEIALLQGERFADPQPCTPKHDDHAAQPETVGAIAGCAHHGDGFLHGRRVRWIAQSLVSRWPALVEAGHGRRRATPTGTVNERCGTHDVLL